MQSHVARVHFDLDQEAGGCRVKKLRKRQNVQRDAAIRMMVERYPTFENKREFLENMVRITSTTLKL